MGKLQHNKTVVVDGPKVRAAVCGLVRDAIKKVTQDSKIFVYGISEKKVGGIELQTPDGNVAPVNPAALGKNVPEPFKSEPTGGAATARTTSSSSLISTSRLPGFTSAPTIFPRPQIRKTA